MTDTHTKHATDEQELHWQSLEERAAHSDTMRPLSPLEVQWLEDYRSHWLPVSPYLPYAKEQ